MSEEEFKDFDCAYEVKIIIDCIKFLDRDCKYILKRPFKIKPIITEVLNNYVDFAQINNNFRTTKITSDIKFTKILRQIFKNVSRGVGQTRRWYLFGD